MKATRGGIVALLDRVLDRGVYLRADVVVTVSGVPLLGISLQAALGAVDTLIEYGVFQRTDSIVRSDPAAAVAPPAGPANMLASDAGAGQAQRGDETSAHLAQ